MLCDWRRGCIDVVRLQAPKIGLIKGLTWLACCAIMQTCTGFEGGNLLQNWGVCRDIVIYLWDIICSLVRLAVVRRFRYHGHVEACLHG